MSSKEEQLHEELLKEFRNYFKANQIWKAKQTRRAAVQTRNHLAKIKQLCEEKRRLIQEWRHTEWEQNKKPNNNPKGNKSSLKARQKKIDN